MLNLGVLIAAATMFSSENVPRVLVAVLFLVGTLLAGLSFLANDVQHRYYQSARERKKDIEEALELKDMALATTPGMGSRIERLGRVGTFLKVMLVAIGVADLLGAGFALANAKGSSGRPPIVSIRFVPPRESLPANGESVLVVSQGQEVMAYRRFEEKHRLATVPLQPGTYQASATALGRICRRPVEVSDMPLQSFTLRCRHR